MRSFEHRCPNPKCRTILAVPENQRGQTVRCANCGQSFFVPFVLEAAKDKPDLRKAG